MPLPVMARLDPAISATVAGAGVHRNYRLRKGGWVYMVTNRPNGSVYVGVTSNLARRASVHREGVADGFTKKYRLLACARLVRLNLMHRRPLDRLRDPETQILSDPGQMALQWNLSETDSRGLDPAIHGPAGQVRG